MFMSSVTRSMIAGMVCLVSCVLGYISCITTFLVFLFEWIFRMDLRRLFSSNKGQMVGTTAGMAIALAIAIVVVGVLFSELDSSITLTGDANSTYHSTQTIIWAGFVVLSVGVLAYVGRWIMAMFS